MKRDDLIDKMKGVVLLLVFVVGPVVFFIATSDGKGRSNGWGDEYDDLRAD